MSDTKMAKNDGIFRVIVHNVNNVPSTERFRGSPDPYINVFYYGSLISFDFIKKFLLYFILLFLFVRY